MQRYIPRVKNVQSAALGFLPSKQGLVQESRLKRQASWRLVGRHTILAVATKFPRGRCQNVETATEV